MESRNLRSSCFREKQSTRTYSIDLQLFKDLFLKAIDEDGP